MKQTGTALIALILIFTLVSGAWALPSLPCDFWGSVTINGQPAAAGTTIAALIDGKVCGEITTTEAGKYGTYIGLGEKLVVQGGDGDAGKTILFTVAGTYAGQNATFVAGEAYNLNLSVSTNSGDSSSGGSSSGSSSYGVSSSTMMQSTSQSAVGTGQLQTTSTGMVTEAVAVTTEDRICTLTVESGVIATGADGMSVQEVTVERISGSAIPSVPNGAAFVFAGQAVECGPAGALFSPAVMLSFTLSEVEWARFLGNDLSIRWYDETAGAWIDLPVEVNEATRTVTARISHFSIFALFAVEKGETVPSPTAATLQTGIPAKETTVPTGESGNITFPWTAFVAILVLIVVVGGVYYWWNGKKQQ